MSVRFPNPAFRIVASKLNSWLVLELMFDAFHLHDCLWLRPGASEEQLARLVVTEPEWVFVLVDGFLKLFLELLLVKSYVELSVEEEVRLEVTHILSLAQQPYSKIRQSLPDRGPDYPEQVNQVFDKVLAEVSSGLFMWGRYVRPHAMAPTEC